MFSLLISDLKFETTSDVLMPLSLAISVMFADMSLLQKGIE